MPEELVEICSYESCDNRLNLKNHVCPLCGKNYCENHLLPEDHECSKLEETPFSKDTPDEEKINQFNNL